MMTSKPAESLDFHLSDTTRAPVDQTMVLIVDAQQRLMPAIESGADVITALDRLLRAADLFEVPARATEHCAEAIGSTVATLARHLDPRHIVAKRHFNAMAEDNVRSAVAAVDRPAIAIAGVEAHVCVAQTALGLREAGYHVRVVEDACGSRREVDREAGLARLRAAGCVPVTVEALIFEWCGSADHPAFKAALSIVKEIG